MITTTTFLHLDAGIPVKVDTAASGAPLVEFGDNVAGTSVTVFLHDVTMAQELARSILARFPIPGVVPLAPPVATPSELAALRAELTGGPRVLTIVDHTHQCRDCRAEVDCDGDPCVFDGSCDACS